MERRYVPLRPLSPKVRQQEQEQQQQYDAEYKSIENRRTRAGVSVACNDCRRKKIRCDGQRPVCSSCQGKTDHCEYRDEGGPSKEARDLVVEVLQRFGQLSSADAVQYIEGLKDETDALTILSTLRQGFTCQHLKADNSIEAALADVDDKDTGQEWQMQNPMAYPGKDSRDIGLFQTEPYRGLIEVPKHRACDDVAMPDAHLATLGDDTSSYEPQQPHELCDPRLHNLDIRHWTDVDVNNDLAAKCISLYLKTDHPLLGHFDPELFVSDLVSKEGEYCTSLLVNSLLYWACQMYSAIDPQTDQIAIRFCAEAESLWTTERRNGNDSTLILAATEFLCLGYLGQGRDHVVLKYLREAAGMASRMGLFGDQGTGGGEVDTSDYSSLTDAAAKSSYMYAAWGTFNWLTLMSFFYHQPGVLCPKSAPRIPIPKSRALHLSSEGFFGHDTENVPSSPEYMGDTFPYLCRFWIIVRDVSWVYNGKKNLTWGSCGSLAFAEFKYRELLAWSNCLPSQLSPNQHGQHHHVQVMHLWFHAAILDIFRPFCNDGARGEQCLTTFNSRNCTPNTVREHSTMRLKRLIVNYRLNYASSNFTILWHTALIYVANAVFDKDRDGDWYSYLLLCLYGYQRLSRSWRVAEAITRGLLSMALRKGDISSTAARRILHDFEDRDFDKISGGVRATFMVDLQHGSLDPDSSTVECLADQFENNAILKEYTTLFDKGQ